MKIILNGENLLLEALKRAKHASFDCILYAQSIEREITDKETLRLAGRYGVNIQDLIFIGKKPLSKICVKARDLSDAETRRLSLLKYILKGKKIYFSRLYMSGDNFHFSDHIQIAFEIESETLLRGKLKRINKRLRKNELKSGVLNSGELIEKKRRKIKGEITSREQKLNAKDAARLLLSAKRDFEFVQHFNTEKFYHNLTIDEKIFSKEEVIGIYSQEKYKKIIDLSDSRERMALIALYAMTFFDLSLSDIYSVGGIFTLDSGREAEQKKRLAGEEVFGLVFMEETAKIRGKAFFMAETLLKIPLPEISLTSTEFIRQNYTLYCGAGDIGRVFSKLLLNLNSDRELEKAKESARRLCCYKTIEDFYNEILHTGEVGARSEKYKLAKLFANSTNGKKTAKELDFSLKKFKKI